MPLCTPRPNIALALSAPASAGEMGKAIKGAIKDVSEGHAMNDLFISRAKVRNFSQQGCGE